MVSRHMSGSVYKRTSVAVLMAEEPVKPKGRSR